MHRATPGALLLIAFAGLPASARPGAGFTIPGSAALPAVLVPAAQRSVKSQAELDAFKAVQGEPDPRAKLAKAEAFLQAFPQSEIRDMIYMEIMTAHHQLGEHTLAVAAGRRAVELNPNSIDGFFNLGVAYMNAEPRDVNLAVWNMARAVALVRVAQGAPDSELEKRLTQIYVSYHGSEEGLAEIIARAGESPVPPADFQLPDPPLYGREGITPRGVLQGGLGSCFIHSPIAALAQANPKKLSGMIRENGDGTFTVTFADGREEKAYLDDLRYARTSGFDRSSGMWVGVLFRAYAQRVLREALVTAVDKSDLFPLLKPYARDFMSTSDLLILAYDRAIRAVVSQSAEVDRAKMAAQLKEEVKPLPIPEEMKESGLKLLDSGGFFQVIETTVKENGEIFGAYRAVGHGGQPGRVLVAFLGGEPRYHESTDPDTLAAQLSDAFASRRPVVAGTSPTPLENLRTSQPLPSNAADWYVTAHAYTVLDYDAASRRVTLRNPWGRKPDPDGVFSIPVETFLETFPFVATVGGK